MKSTHSSIFAKDYRRHLYWIQIISWKGRSGLPVIGLENNQASHSHLLLVSKKLSIAFSTVSWMVCASTRDSHRYANNYCNAVGYPLSFYSTTLPVP